MQEAEAVEDIVIVGAGLAGLAVALGLHRKGVRSLVLESSPTLRASGFAFTTWTNAFAALDALGVGDKIREHHLRIERLDVVSSSTGKVVANLDLIMQGGRGPPEIRCVRRNFLLQTLEKELPRDSIRYSWKIVAIEEDANTNIKILHSADGSILRAKVLIGCDGVNSVVGKWLGLPKPSFSGRSATRGFAEYPDGHGFGETFYMFIGEGFRAGLLPCSDTNIYWFYTWSPSADDKDADESATKMKQYVLTKLRTTKIPREVTDVIERSEMNDVLSAPLRFRSPLSLLCAHISKGNVCVAGDALHPMTPDVGQGGCSALEDGVVLARCLSEAILSKDKKREEHERLEASLKKYAEIRRWRSIQLIATAYTVGFIQQSNNVFVSYLREKFFSGVLAAALLKMSEYDCGKL